VPLREQQCAFTRINAAKMALRQDRRLALHPFTPAALPVAPVRTILENLALWLLVMNGVLLALLVLLASLLLLHHHQ
jgi:hypothetical protein